MEEARKDIETQGLTAERLDPGLAALSLIAGYYRIGADPIRRDPSGDGPRRER
jgi:hypothetical protein